MVREAPLETLQDLLKSSLPVVSETTRVAHGIMYREQERHLLGREDIFEAISNQHRLGTNSDSRDENSLRIYLGLLSGGVLDRGLTELAREVLHKLWEAFLYLIDDGLDAEAPVAEKPDVLDGFDRP
jgi:hypothetical protein